MLYVDGCSAVNSCPASPTTAVVYAKSAPASSRLIKPQFVTDAVVAKDDRIPLFGKELVYHFVVVTCLLLIFCLFGEMEVCL